MPNLPNITPELVALCVIWYIVFLFSTTCHEAAHALAAKMGGDLTAYHGGQVSLNPLPHIERAPVGMVAAPLISFFLQGGTWMIGWASAPYDPRWADRYPRRAAWMALAGPAANFALLLIAAAGIRIGMALGYLDSPEVVRFPMVTVATQPEAGFAATFLSVMFVLNLVLGVFNLLPAPPLDGHAGITLLMPERTATRFLEATREGPFQLAGLLVAWYAFGYVFQPVFLVALNLLYPGAGYGSHP
jgi:Zn-dependent protease